MREIFPSSILFLHPNPSWALSMLYTFSLTPYVIPSFHLSFGLPLLSLNLLLSFLSIFQFCSKRSNHCNLFSHIFLLNWQMFTDPLTSSFLPILSSVLKSSFLPHPFLWIRTRACGMKYEAHVSVPFNTADLTTNLNKPFLFLIYLHVTQYFLYYI